MTIFLFARNTTLAAVVLAVFGSSLTDDISLEISGHDSGASDGTIPAICPPDSEDLTLNVNEIFLTETTALGLTNSDEISIIEGPVWIEGALYFSKIGGGTNPPPSAIYKMVPGSRPVALVQNSGSNGLATDGTRLFAAMHSDGSISTRDLPNLAKATAIVEMDGVNGDRFNAPNDLVVASDGTVFFTDPNYQAPTANIQGGEFAYSVKDGEAVSLDMENAPSQPNGITLSSDERYLYIGGGNGLFKYGLNVDGSLQTPAQKLTSEDLDFDNVDGMGRDCAGNIYAAVHEKNIVVVFDPSGNQIAKLKVPAGAGVTNIAFGGEDRRTLYVTSLGAPPRIHEARLNVPGYPY